MLFVSQDRNRHGLRAFIFEYSVFDLFAGSRIFDLFDGFCFLIVQVLSAKVPSADERDDWWHAFYRGPAFLTLARFLLLGIL